MKLCTYKFTGIIVVQHLSKGPSPRLRINVGDNQDIIRVFWGITVTVLYPTELSPVCESLIEK